MLFQRLYNKLAVLLDCLISSPANGQVLTYNGSIGQWTNAPATLTGAIPESQVTGLTANLAALAPIASPAFTGNATFSGAVHAVGNIVGTATLAGPHNTLDDGSGNAFFAGTVQTENATLDNGAGGASLVSLTTGQLHVTGSVSGITATGIGLGNVSNSLQLTVANNLSDLASISAARANLGLGTAAVTAASAYDAAGSAIAAVAYLPRIFNVKAYGAVGDGATNDAAAIQSAITAAYAAGGGVVFFPAATYLVNTLSNTGTFNSILSIPVLSIASAPIQIDLVGEFTTQPSNFYLVSQPVSISGVIIKTTTTAAGTASAILATCTYTPTNNLGPFSETSVKIKNITFMQPVNPQLICVQARYGGPTRLENVACVVNALQVSITQPAHSNGIGVFMPAENNPAVCYCDDFYAQGYYTGLVIDEHFDAGHVSTFQCLNAIQVGSTTGGGGHGMRIGRLLAQWCPHVIVVYASAGRVNLTIERMDVENGDPAGSWSAPYTGSPNWGTAIDHVLDVSNYLVGQITSYCTGSDGITGNGLIVNGGKNVLFSTESGLIQSHGVEAITAGSASWGNYLNPGNSTYYYFQNPGALNDSFQIQFQGAPGSYNFFANLLQGNGGQVTFYIDGVAIGMTDTYNATTTVFGYTNTLTLVGWGPHTLKGVVTGKNSSSTNYGIFMSTWGLTAVGN